MAFWDGLMNWLGYGNEESLKDDELQTDKESQSVPIPQGGKLKVVGLPTARNAMRLVVTRPKSFDQAATLAENLKNYRPLIVNVEDISIDEARRIIDFLSGATFALGGRVRKVTNGIFLFTSSNVDLSGDLVEDKTEGANWLKLASRAGK
ncbi:MAG: cell division inhibitor SepF [Clostridia bacterium]|nr:cell division inhibitor SepF [Clostridia bacterium]